MTGIPDRTAMNFRTTMQYSRWRAALCGALLALSSVLHAQPPVARNRQKLRRCVIAYITFTAGNRMNIGFILLTLIGFVLALAFVHVLNKMDHEREVAARRRRNGIKPFSDDTVTYSGHS